jgi:hypothetical protein
MSMNLVSRHCERSEAIQSSCRGLLRRPEKIGTPRNDVLPQAWVIFTGQGGLPWLKFLKKGFRHCYVLLNDGDHWISMDPMANYMDVSVHNHVPADFDLPRWLKTRGHTVVRAPVSRIKKEAPWMMFTCTEAVKRVLGLHRRFIFTPWQLYRHLQDFKGEYVWEV